MALLKFKRSAVPAKVPALNDLALGELAINTYDGKVYTKKDDGTPAWRLKAGCPIAAENRSSIDRKVV